MKFEPGKTYYARSNGESDCIIRVKVIRRTAQTMRAEVDGNPAKTLRISDDDGVEQVKPWGNYSMAPLVRARSSTEPKQEPEPTKRAALPPAANEPVLIPLTAERRRLVDTLRSVARDLETMAADILAGFDPYERSEPSTFAIMAAGAVQDLMRADGVLS